MHTEKKPNLILLRHGKSAWNQKNVFTGWVDIPLHEAGIAEALSAGEQIASTPIDVIYVSSLFRAQQTAMIAMSVYRLGKTPCFIHQTLGGGKPLQWEDIHDPQMQQEIIPVLTAWELNERMYGELQGLNKAKTVERFGAEQVQLWRRSYHTAPPQGESLAETVARAAEFFHREIASKLEQGQTVFVVSHGNTLRGLIKEIEHLSEEAVSKLEIATGQPLFYAYDPKTKRGSSCL